MNKALITFNETKISLFINNLCMFSAPLCNSTVWKCFDCAEDNGINFASDPYRAFEEIAERAGSTFKALQILKNHCFPSMLQEVETNPAI